MKSWILAALFLIAGAVPVLAVDETVTPPREPGANFEEKKIEILHRIDDRIAREQQLKGCVQAAKSRADVHDCREKHHPKRDGERKADRQGKSEPSPERSM